MELISSQVDPDDFFLEPLQYVFQDGDQERVFTFVPTVPHGAEAVRIFGDLFDCRLREINYESVPVPIGSDAELQMIQMLEQFADSQKTKEQQWALRYGKFPKMDMEMVGWRTLLWFIESLTLRRSDKAHG